jgi:iron complex transport system substrate-binding protein
MKRLLILVAVVLCATTTYAQAIRYAKGFKITKLRSSTLVEVIYPHKGATSGYKYLLVKKGTTPPKHDTDVKVIFTPIERIVCTSTTHIPLLDYLNISEKLVGFPTTDYISSEKTRKLVDAGKVEELGAEKGMNIEKLAVLKPDAVMSYTMTADLGQLKKVQELGIPVILNAEYLEEHPLGRAEWIKFMAQFFDKEKEAEIAFTTIEKNYLEIKKLVSKAEKKPTVLSGVMYGDAWFMPGGQNYAAKLINDAGATYLWSSDSTKGFLQLSFESVYEKAHAADLWIGIASFETLEEIKNADERYTKFNPYQIKQVYTFNARKGPKGGSEFLELGYLRPDIILKDLVKITHPELLPDYLLYFHRRLVK